jgi:hypothetical protein
MTYFSPTSDKSNYKNGKAYDISYSADLDRYDSVLPTVQAMINSFVLLPPLD